MRVIVRQDYEDVSHEAAYLVARQLQVKPNSVLGLPTGETPIGMYAELSRLYKRGSASFSQATTFNLDEFLGLPAVHPQSCHYYMLEHLLPYVDLEPSSAFILDGMTSDVDAECLEYENAFTQRGGIDLQVLGIGLNGHIGFNEPGTDWETRVALARLSDVTRRREVKRFGGLENVPDYALTMGIKAIMLSRSILLLATGKEKAAILLKALHGPITPEIPASVLQLHPDVTVVVDETASQGLGPCLDL